MTDHTEVVARIVAAVNAYNRPAAEAACDDFIAAMQDDEEPCPAKPVRAVLGALRRKRYFGLMERVGDNAIRSGQNDFQIRRQYAQALIEGRI